LFWPESLNKGNYHLNILSYSSEGFFSLGRADLAVLPQKS
jgi:hypothetical protein